MNYCSILIIFCGLSIVLHFDKSIHNLLWTIWNTSTELCVKELHWNFSKSSQHLHNKQLKKLMTKALGHEFHIFYLYIMNKLFEKIKCFFPSKNMEQIGWFGMLKSNLHDLILRLHNETLMFEHLNCCQGHNLKSITSSTKVI